VAFTTFEKKRISLLLDDYCEKRVSARVRHQLRIDFKFRGNTVTLIEARVNYRKPEEWTESPFAQFRRVEENGVWRLYCRGRNQQWKLFEPHPESKVIEELLAVVDKDSTRHFYG